MLGSGGRQGASLGYSVSKSSTSAYVIIHLDSVFIPGVASQPAAPGNLVWLCSIGVSGTFPAFVRFIRKRTVLPGALVLILDSIAGSSVIRRSWNSVISTCNSMLSLTLVPSYGSSLRTFSTMLYVPASVFSGTLMIKSNSFWLFQGLFEVHTTIF